MRQPCGTGQGGARVGRAGSARVEVVAKAKLPFGCDLSIALAAFRLRNGRAPVCPIWTGQPSGARARFGVKKVLTTPCKRRITVKLTVELGRVPLGDTACRQAVRSPWMHSRSSRPDRGYVGRRRLRRACKRVRTSPQSAGLKPNSNAARYGPVVNSPTGGSDGRNRDERRRQA
jgi:hypothetical protein